MYGMYNERFGFGNFEFMLLLIPYYYIATFKKVKIINSCPHPLDEPNGVKQCRP